MEPLPHSFKDIGMLLVQLLLLLGVKLVTKRRSHLGLQFSFSRKRTEDFAEVLDKMRNIYIAG
jgi:hypothetical protein